MPVMRDAALVTSGPNNQADQNFQACKFGP
jgi:hypothetical protein